MKLHTGGSFSRGEAAHPDTHIGRGLAWGSSRFAALAALGCAVLVIAATACSAGDNSAATPTAEVGASVLFQRLIDGINTGDVAAAMAVFADDAVSEGGPACAKAPCVGRAAIQTDIQVYVHEHVGFSQCGIESSGDTATAKCEVRTNGTRRAGIERFVGTLTVTARGGKLSVFRWGALDISDELTATYFGSAGPALYRQYVDAINRGDVDALMALFADDAVVEGGAHCSAGPCAGKEAIREVVERQVAAKINLISTRPELFDPFAAFSRITDVLVEVTRWAGGAAGPAVPSIEVNVKDGKIASVWFATGVEH